MLVKALFFGALGALFLGMMAMQIAGHHYGTRRIARVPLASSEGTAAVEAVLFAMLGLLLAFTFSGAQTRLDARRALIVAEANAIGTAYLRLDLLPAQAQPRLRDDFRRYVDSRMTFYRELLNLHVARAERRYSAQLQEQIWNDALAAADASRDYRATLLVVPALNEMFDITISRDAALRTHLPLAIFVLLLVLAFACAFFAGIGMSKRKEDPSRLHIFMFAAAMAVTAYVILNVEFPRAGFVPLDSLDQLLRDIRSSMG
jgi:hypothetical protein